MNYSPNFEELNNLCKKNYLRKNISPCRKLVLYNYTQKTNSEKKWNEHTINSRGTIYEISTGDIIAYTFPKFWNFGELPNEMQNKILNESHFEVSEKMDGSLGIIYFYDGEWKVNTRGSFDSNQAKKAKLLLQKYNIDQLDKNLTYLCEIIYPENKIIVEYGQRQELILLAIFGKNGQEHIITGGEPFPSSKKYIFKNVQEILNTLTILSKNEEGYVVKLSDGQRIKFKGKQYLDQIKGSFNLSQMTVWKNLNNGIVDRKVFDQLPEEFSQEFEDICRSLETSYSNAKEKIIAEFNKFREKYPNSISMQIEENIKLLNLYLMHNKYEYSNALYYLIKGQIIPDKFLMNLIKPSFNH